MSNYSESEGSVIDDLNQTFRGGDSSYYKQTKSPFKGETVRLVHSKLQKHEENEGEESEDSEYAEDEDLWDEDEQFMRKKKKQIKDQSKAKHTKQQVEESEQEGDEEGDEDAESEEEEDEDDEPLPPKELPKRQTRGKRMNLLVGQALDEDEAFWGNEMFKENEEDESFSASSEAKDSFDSDFDKSEHSNEGEGAEDSIISAEKEIKRKARAAEKKRVKFLVPNQKNKPKPKAKVKSILKKKPVVEQKGEEDKSSNASESITPAARRSKRMIERREGDSDDSDSDKDDDGKERKKSAANPQKTAERRREIKEKNKAFLESHGITGDVQDKWTELLSKDKLTPIEKIQEAALTEVINKESLSYLQEIENERVNEMIYRDRRPKGPRVKIIQDIKPGHFNSRMVFPSADFYPKNFNTRKERHKEKFLSKNYQLNTCMITGKKAKYKDPLTLTPFANKDAFKVVRERFFQKEEDKLNMRIHIINELLNQKRDKLKRYQSFDRNLEISQEQREIIMKNSQRNQFNPYK